MDYGVLLTSSFVVAAVNSMRTLLVQPGWGYYPCWYCSVEVAPSPMAASVCCFHLPSFRIRSFRFLSSIFPTVALLLAFFVPIQ